MKSKCTFRAALTVGVMLAGGLTISAAADARPGDLLIFYSYPSAINNVANLPDAITEFAKYDIVVIGDGLQDGPGDPNPHPDHANTVQIVNAPETDHVIFFGYIDLGVTTDNHSLTEIQRRVDAWQALGVDGIFLDDFGYDFGVTRARQNAAVSYVHTQGMPVCANGFFPDDVFSSAVHPNNPGGDATQLGSNDYYLSESDQITEGEYVTIANWQTKANALREYQQQLGVEILSVTTTLDTFPYEQNKFWYAWYSAALYGHLATGWGEYLFASDDNLAPYRARPVAELGPGLESGVYLSGENYSRRTSAGIIWIEGINHTFGFTPLPDSDGDLVADAYDICPLTPPGIDVSDDGRPVGDLNCDCRIDMHDISILQINAYVP
jgi:hypothetical protein